MTKCDKCAGKGYIEKFIHFQNGKCFRCDGTGQVEVMSEDTAEAIRMRKEENGIRFAEKLKNWKPKEIPVEEFDFDLPF